MKFDKITLTELHPAEYNPRQISESELNKLSQNLEEFGLVDPIIIDLTDNNTIIGGHQRYKILCNNHNPWDKLNLIQLGDIGWVFEDTNLKIKDKNHQKALNISLNKIQGEWDYNKLEDLILDLNSNDYLIELTGFERSFFNLDIDFSEQPLDSLPELSHFETKEETPTEHIEKPVSEETNPNSITPVKEDKISDKENIQETYIIKVKKECLPLIKELIGEEKVNQLLSDTKYGIEIINKEPQ